MRQDDIKGDTMNYKQLLESAASAGACKEHLSIARQYDSFEEAMKDPQAPYWANWYAREVIKGRWVEGEAMNNDAAQAKLADIERQVKELREQLAAPGHWVPGPKESYLHVNLLGRVVEDRNDGTEHDEFLIANGNAYPDTHEGRAAAEHAAFLIGFRARWRLSADVAQNEPGYLPTFGEGGMLRIYFAQLGYGLLKWSTPQKCRAFVDSEGGPERFAEILGRGIL